MRFDLRRPPRCDIAILDDSVATELMEYVTQHSVGAIDLGGRRWNVWALTRAIARGRWDQFGYVCEYLKLMNPKVCITLIDSTPHIYRIKNYLPSIKTIAIQNGWRGYETKRGLMEHIDPMVIDHMLCFGEAGLSVYQTKISGNFHLIGGFRSNKVPVQKNSNSNVLALISTLRPKVNLAEPASSYSSLPPVSYAEIFRRRLELATYVAEFCRQASMKLMVIGKDFDSSREQELYAKTLENASVDWEFRPRNSLLDSYFSLDHARIAVSTSSSLGYEALGRGIRSAFFMLDPEVTGNWGDKFGWPLIEQDDGPIWANYLDRERTIGTLWDLHNMSDEEWLELRGEFVPRLITQDPGNETLKTVLAKCMERQDDTL